MNIVQAATEKSIESLPYSQRDCVLGMIIIAATIFVIALTGRYASLRNVNWDEFYYLSQVYDYVEGRPLRAIQTLHVHFFQFLASTGETEIAEIKAARAVMFVLHVGTCVLVYIIGRQRLRSLHAAFAVLAFSGFTYVVSGGFSFRTDPLANFLVVFTGWCLLKGHSWADITAAFIFSVAALVTIKVFLFLPCLLGVLVYRDRSAGRDWQAIVGRGLRFCGVVALFSLVGLQLHAKVLGFTPVEAASQTASVSARAGGKTLASQSLFPRSSYAVFSIWQNAGTWGLILVAAGLAAAYLRRQSTRRDGLWLFTVLSPLASLIVYRNAFPYFYVMLLPWASLAAAEAFAWIHIHCVRRSPAIVTTGLVAIPLMNALVVGVTFVPRMFDQQATQREHALVIHSMFPQPVPYIDRNSSISRFPKVGFFMSSWGLEDYRAADKPVFEEVIKDTQPHFLLVNCKALDVSAIPAQPRTGRELALLEEDRKAIASTFIPFWGQIFVPGHRFSSLAPEEPTTFKIQVAGEYVLCSSVPMEINGRVIQNGERLYLDRGEFTILSAAPANDVELRIATAIDPPTSEPSAQPYFYGLKM